MARGESRGGGYDASIDKQQEKRKTLGTETRQDANSQTPSSVSGDTLQAPSSLGDLMTPSTPGRAAQPASPDEFNARVAENHSFLTHPDTRASMLDFATAMLGGGEHMRALGTGIRQNIQNEIENEQRARQLDLSERGQNIELRGQDIQMRGQDISAKGSPSELMKTIEAAKEAKASGDMKSFNVYMSRAYQIANEFSAPSGQVTKYDADGNPMLTNIPGGKADLEAQQAQLALEQARTNELNKSLIVNGSADQVITAIDSSDNPNLTITGFGGLLNFIPASESQNVAAAIQNIQSNLTIDQLKAVRDASKTGGAFGNISDYEDRLLSSTVATLRQTMDAQTLRKQLMMVKFMFDPAMNTAKKDISKQVQDGTLTPTEGENAYQTLFQQYSFGAEAGNAASSFDPKKAPSYVTPELQQVWGQLDPMNPEDQADIMTHLSPKDQRQFQLWLQKNGASK
jgi:hypothetical protein